MTRFAATGRADFLFLFIYHANHRNTAVRTPHHFDGDILLCCVSTQRTHLLFYFNTTISTPHSVLLSIVFSSSVCVPLQRLSVKSSHSYCCSASFPLPIHPFISYHMSSTFSNSQKNYLISSTLIIRHNHFLSCFSVKIQKAQ